jgi:DNA-binding SARP family transcriptional activator
MVDFRSGDEVGGGIHEFDARIHLLNGPYVSIDGEFRDIPEGSKRLLAFVAIQTGRLDRRYVAGSLWPGGDDNRASGNLRSSLWRLRKAHIDVIDADKWSLGLGRGVRVDLDEIESWARRMVSGIPAEGDFNEITAKAGALDLLPGYYEDWAITERERVRQQVLHGLERMSRLLRERGRYGEAVEAAMTAVFCEPLRESAQRVLIEAHLAEGNVVEARVTYRRYAQLIRRELGIEPSPELRAMVGATSLHRVYAT